MTVNDRDTAAIAARFGRSRGRSGHWASACLAGAALAAALGPQVVAAQWVEPSGQGWVQLAVYHHDTGDEYDFDGVRKRIRNNGHAVATSTFVTAAFGLLRGLDAWVQFPFHFIDYTDFSGDRSRNGFGDIRTYLRVAPLRFLGSDLPLAVRAGVKLPMGDFPLDAEIVPLGEGQRDWEVMLELGHSFYPRSEYVMGWVGYRWREEDFERRRDFGDEAFFLAAVGGRWGPAGYKVTVEGWDGRPPVLEGIRLASASRQMFHVTPTASYPVGTGALEAGVRVPFAGQNLPAGPALVLGYFFRIGAP